MFLSTKALFVLALLTKASLAKNPRIIGGSLARSGQFPFAAAINITTSNSRHFCGGSLISNQWVLTSGHCVDGAILLSILLGSLNLASPDSSAVDVATSEYELHPDYEADSYQANIGLIRFHIAITLNEYVRPLYLPTADDVDSGRSVVALGWGQVSDFNEQYSSVLNYVNLVPLSLTECRITYGNLITDSMLCAAGNFNQGTCVGDIGGPLIEHRTGTVTWIIGTASFISSNGCESPDPSGFTKVFPYVEWIYNTTEPKLIV